MNVARRLLARLATYLAGAAQHRIIDARSPDFVIGGEDDLYLLRWFVIPRNRWLNVYLHLFRRSDDDRALHDHPWVNASLLLRGSYVEHTIAAGGINRRVVRTIGDVALRRSTHAHRIELHAGECMTLFVTGPWLRIWGFHCPDTGWVDWRKFTGDDGTTIGRGCDQ